MNYKCRLKIIFAEREIKVGEFAEKIGVSRTALSSIINNRTLPSFETIFNIEKELNLRMIDVWTAGEQKEN